MNKILFEKGKKDDWATPKNIYNYFCKELGYYDPCKLYELKEKNNIFNDFGNKPLFINPPYSKLKDWIEYAIFYHRIYKNNIIMLIPVRADTIGFHLLIDYGCDFYFVKGRLKFSESKNTAPFASVFVILTNKTSRIKSISKESYYDIYLNIKNNF